MIEVHIDSLTKIISFVNVEKTLTLLEAQKQQIAVLTSAYENSTQVFVSSALGSTHTYLADDTSMGKFNAEYTFINGNTYDGSSINWYTVEQGGVIHTKEQFNQVWMDGRNYLANQFNKWDSLVKQINTCADVNSVQVISW